MSTNEKKKRMGIGAKALKTSWENIGEMIFIAVANLAARVGVLAPFYLLTVSRQGPTGTPAGIAVSLALYVLLIPPLRCWTGERLRRMYYSRHKGDRQRLPYDHWLVAGLLRYLRGFLWGLPFLACVAYFAVGYSTLTVPDMWRPIQNLPKYLGMEAGLRGGIIIAGAVMLLLALLFAYGWWRDMPVEYLPIRSVKPSGAYHWTKRLRKRYRGRLIRHAMVNVLLSLPAAIAAGVVLAPQIWGKIDLSGPMAMTSSVQALLNGLFSQKTVLLLAGVFFLVYLPLCLYRKARNAALVSRMMKMHDTRTNKKKEARREEAYLEESFSEDDVKAAEKPREEKGSGETDGHAAG